MKALLLLLAVLGCEGMLADYTEEIVARECYTEIERNALADAVLTCIKNGNPMSDEEGEDLVRQCAMSMEIIVCPEHKVRVRYDHAGNEKWRRVVE